MLLYPKEYINSVKDITIEFIEKNNLKGLILDVDNTLIDYYKKMPDGIAEWVEELKKHGVKFYILSNSNKREKVENVAKKINVEYVFFAKKPLKTGFLKIKKLMNLQNENIGVVGDQILTDVLGANRCKMFSILVKPINEKDIFVTKFNRFFENIVIKRYLKNSK